MKLGFPVLALALSVPHPAVTVGMMASPGYLP